MFHDTKAPAGAVEFKGEEDDPAAVVTKALDAFKGEEIGRLDKVEEKAGTADKIASRLDGIEAKLNRPGSGRDGATEPSLEAKAFGVYLRRGREAPDADLKTLTVSPDTQGGYLAPPELSGEILRDIVEFSPVRSIASVRTTSSPAVLYPRRVGSTNARWVGETEARTASEPTFGQTEISVKEVATFVPISNQLLADSGGSVEAEIRLALAEDFGKKEATAFISGSGPKEPSGILLNADIGVTLNGHATNLSADALITLMYALPATYRNRGTWLMNGSTLAAIRKLKDGHGNYLWQPAYAAGQPESILGRPVVEAVDMPDIAADAFPVLFGDFATGYRIVDRLALSILVDPYTGATESITRLHATRRTGAGVIQPSALRKLEMAAS